MHNKKLIRVVLIIAFLIAFLASVASIISIANIRKKVYLVKNSTSVTIPTPSPSPTPAWKEVFDDEFTSNTLDPTKWVTCYDWQTIAANGCTNAGNQELEWYVPQQVTQASGQVTLTAIHSSIQGTVNGTTSTSYPYQSGMISTGRSDSTAQPLWSGTYGYYEARMKIPTGQGVWPAFWLLPVDTSWPPEIDIMEETGDKPNQIIMTYHWKNNSGQPAKDYTIYKGTDFTTGWHTYAVDWEPSSIKWYIDGVLRKSVTGSMVPSKPMEIILDLAVGGNLPKTPSVSTKFPAQVQVDYVRVYQKP